MKGAGKLALCFVWTLALLGLSASGVVAAENGSSWRGTYDMVMMWLNFGILVFVAVKFGKAPIMNFLKGRKVEVELQIQGIEDEKREMQAKIDENLKLLDESSVRLAQLKDKVAEQGQQRKEEIIESARRQSQNMMEEAKKRIDTHILHAHDTFRAELIDAAIALAMKRLPEEVTQEDNSRLVENWLASTVAK